MKIRSAHFHAMAQRRWRRPAPPGALALWPKQEFVLFPRPRTRGARVRDSPNTSRSTLPFQAKGEACLRDGRLSATGAAAHRRLRRS